MVQRDLNEAKQTPKKWRNVTETFCHGIPYIAGHLASLPSPNDEVFMAPTSSIAVVARIAYLASHVVVDSQPSLPAISVFGKSYHALTKEAAHHPTVVSIPSGADPGVHIRSHSSANLVSFTTVSSSNVLTRLFLHLSELSSRPLVLHVAVKDDLADVMLLRSSVPFFILSKTSQQSHDNAILASRLALSNSQTVIHAFYVDEESSEVDEIAEDRLGSFLLLARNGSIDQPLGLHKTYEAMLSTASIIRRPICPWDTHGSTEAHTTIFTLGKYDLTFDLGGVLFVSMSLLNPLPASSILGIIPPSTTRVFVFEQIRKWTMKWTPLYLEILSALQQRDPANRPSLHYGILGDTREVIPNDIQGLLDEKPSKLATIPLQIGIVSDDTPFTVELPHVPKHETSYTKILSQLFSERLEIVNSPSLVLTQGEIATSPEYALGRVIGQFEQRDELIRVIKELLESDNLDSELHSLFSRWVLAKDDPVKSGELGDTIVKKLESSAPQITQIAHILALKAHLYAMSKWIIGSDAWSYDLGSSGLHHAIASGLDINILILDTVPYSTRNTADPNRRKHDIGLYAMNRGDVYVASVAVYSSYSQVLQAFLEADRYRGPSVVLAYLPYTTENCPALEILKETKLAVDAGYWPLYRWNPAKEREGKESFALDSDSVKNDLQQFLDRQNHLSQLVLAKPLMASELVGSLGESLKEARKKRLQQSYNDLLTNINSFPLLVLYASDGGTAEKFAKRIASRGQFRGLSTTVATMDSVPLESLAEEDHVVFVASVAGQGEPPQNGRRFFKALNAAVARGDKTLSKLRFAVFGLGDSHYWPRPEDAHYYNKASKDLNARLEQLGGTREVELGLGDDQDADGPETGYKIWEPQLWKVLGVDSVEVTAVEPEPITNEHIKAASRYLRGTILEGLDDTSTGALAASDTQLTKFHGIYQQDDRDIRDERQAQGVEPAYSFMIRVRMPGGVCKPDQWLRMDQIADEHGCGTFKITTRQTFQFHGVIKKHLKPSIQAINAALLDTLAACGDVNRNVICSAIPTLSDLHCQVFEFAKGVSEHLLPRTTAYHEIWLDKKMVAGDALKDFEPLYGEFYLPRKFKIAVAVPPTNDVDVFTNDVGFIAIIEGGKLSGFNVTIGGGMGVTHGNKKTYPRIGDVLGFCTVVQGADVAEKIMLVQRDHGNRVDRKNARLKYTVDRLGLEVFKAEIEKRLGYALQPARPYKFDRNIDDFGWATGQDGKHYFTMFIENGRIQDEPGREYKTGLRQIAKIHKGTFRLTANQHLVLAQIPSAELSRIRTLLAKYKLDNLSQSSLRLSSSACVAFPTCGLAMAESERYLPVLIDKIEKICEENGLRNDSIVMRMTGCPNGCARPYVAEVAFVGKAPGSYAMLLGGGYHGQRLNKIYRETVTEPEILAILRPMIKQYALKRLDGEHFGDFTIRAGYISPTTSGKAWYEGMGGEGQYQAAV